MFGDLEYVTYEKVSRCFRQQSVRASCARQRCLGSQPKHPM